MLSKQGVALIARRPVSRSNQIQRAIINPVAVIHRPAVFFFAAAARSRDGKLYRLYVERQSDASPYHNLTIWSGYYGTWNAPGHNI